MATNLAPVSLRLIRRILQNPIKSTNNVATKKMSSVPESVRIKQELLQSGEKHIYIKGGAMDSVTYRLTMGLTVLSLSTIAFTIFRFAFKGK